MLNRRKTRVAVALSAMAAVLVAVIVTTAIPRSSPDPGDPGAPFAVGGRGGGPPGGASPARAQEGLQDSGLQGPGDVEGHNASSPQPVGTEVDDFLTSKKDVVVDFSQFRQLLPKDAIQPVYEPRFTSAKMSGLHPGELVIGVEINGESKAYPVGPLNFREMVNDVVGGVPILVSW